MYISLQKSHFKTLKQFHFSFVPSKKRFCCSREGFQSDSRHVSLRVNGAIFLSAKQSLFDSLTTRECNITTTTKSIFKLWFLTIYYVWQIRRDAKKIQIWQQFFSHDSKPWSSNSVSRVKKWVNFRTSKKTGSSQWKWRW